MSAQLAETGRRQRVTEVMRGTLSDIRTGIYSMKPDIPTTPQAFDIQSPQIKTGSGKLRRLFDRAAASLGAVAAISAPGAPLAEAQVMGTPVQCVDGVDRPSPLSDKGGMLIVLYHGKRAAFIDTEVSQPHPRTSDESSRTIVSVEGVDGHYAEVKPPNVASSVKLVIAPGQSGTPVFTIDLHRTSADCRPA